MCCSKVIKCSESLAFYLFSPNHLIISIIYEHSCKILYLRVYRFHSDNLRKGNINDLSRNTKGLTYTFQELQVYEKNDNTD